jgi:hypothetical protein
MRVLLSSALVSIGLLSLASPASAADNAMKVCGAKYQAAKSAKTLPAGETWNQFLAQCRKGLGTSATAASVPARPTLASASRPASHLPGAQSPAMMAMHNRQRQCGQQWKADKAAGRIPAGQTWPKYWSACNARLKH